MSFLRLLDSWIERGPLNGFNGPLKNWSASKVRPQVHWLLQEKASPVRHPSGLQPSHTQHTVQVVQVADWTNVNAKQFSVCSPASA